MNERYPYPVSVGAWESLWGYTHRLAEENFVYRHVGLRKHIAVIGNSADLHRGQLEKLFRISGVSIAALRRMQHGFAGRLDANFFGNRIRRRRLEFVRSRLCPLCYLDTGYHNRIFDLRVLRACPIHQIELVEFCPTSTCKVGLSWHRNAISCCSSGHSLWSGQQLDFVPRKIERPLLAERLIFERCGQPVDERSVLATLPETVRKLTLEGQLTLFTLLGDASLDFPRAYRRGRARRFDNIDTWVMLNDGLALAEGLPHSFMQWLEVRYAPSNNGPSDIGKRIRPLQHALSDSICNEVPALKLLRGLLTEFAREKGHLGKVTSGWVEPLDPTSNQMTLEQAADLMKVGVRKAKTVAKREQWAKFAPKQDARVTPVPKAAVFKWLDEGGDELRCGEAARLLGIVESEVMDLAKHRVVGGFHGGRNDSRNAKRSWHFKRYSIQKLKERLRKSVTTPGRGGGIISYRQYRTMTRGPAVAYWKLIKAVLTGRIRPVKWPSDRLEDLMFRLGDLDLTLRGTDKRAPRKLKSNNISAITKMHSVKALQSRFSTSTRVISAAIDLGYLRATASKDDDPQVSDSDLAAFERYRVFVGKVAKDRKIPSMVVLIHDLEDAGILPEARVADSAEGLLYRVADIKKWDAGRKAA